MRAKKVRTEVRREQIVAAALALVGRRGWGAFSVEALAGEVGVVPSAIYRHYRSKGAVLNGLLGLIGRRLEENVGAVCAGVADPVERLRLVLERHVRMVCENRGIPRAVFSEEVIAGDGARRARLRGVLQGYLARIGGIIREGQAMGRVRRELRPDTLAVMFLGLVQPAAVLNLVSGGRFDAMRFQREAWDVFETAIVAGGRVEGGEES
jgi:AcrR family transcriptional regulator